MEALHAVPSSCWRSEPLHRVSLSAATSTACHFKGAVASPSYRSLSALANRKRRTREKAPISMAQASIGLIESLQGQVNTEGVKAEEGQGGLPKLVLTNPSGSQAEIYIFGACVTSWRLSSGKDLLFVRPDALFNGQKPISGGIPHCFPQFGPGLIQQHGFARNVPWSITNSSNLEGNPSVVFELKDSDYTRDIWNYNFLATYKVTLEPHQLSTMLIVKNTDDKPFTFTTALHTYFSASAGEAVVKGLKGCKSLNKVPDPMNPISGVEEREEVNFPGFVDCVYIDVPAELSLKNGLGEMLSITNENWSDAVLWNPHTNAPGNIHKDFVCVENAKTWCLHLKQVFDLPVYISPTSSRVLSSKSLRA